MFTGYVVVAVLAAAANSWAATIDFTHAETALANAAKVEVPPSWLFPLGALKAAGALGLLVGMAVPFIGVAAAIGLVLFFVCAIFAHLRGQLVLDHPLSSSASPTRRRRAAVAACLDVSGAAQFSLS